MSLVDDVGVWPAAGALAVGALVIGWAGPRLARSAGGIAHHLGIGDAIAGSVLLGASTSLSGLFVSMTTALDDEPGLAVANAMGGIAAQTAFLAVADFFKRDVNLEHVASDPGNLFMSFLLVALLSGVLLAMGGPAWSWRGVHPMSLLLPLTYVLGLRIASGTDEEHTWAASPSRWQRQFGETDDGAEPPPLGRLWTTFGVSAAATGASGWVIGEAAITLTAEAGLRDGVVGGLFTALATSSAELVTAIAAVRAGAYSLAVGDIIGGNVFDVLFVTAADVGYRGGSIYHSAGDQGVYLTSLCLVLSAVLGMGLIRRQPRGPANVGFESIALLVIYVGGMAIATLF